jgi:hypothetical protein
MLSMSPKYIYNVYALHVSAAQGHLQATHLFKESTALFTLPIVLLKYVVVIINFVLQDVYSSYQMYSLSRNTNQHKTHTTK